MRSRARPTCKALVVALALLCCASVQARPDESPAAPPGTVEGPTDAVLSEYDMQVFDASVSARMGPDPAAMPEVEARLAALIADPRFATAARSVRAAAYSGISWAQGRQGRRREALAWLEKMQAEGLQDDDDLKLMVRVQSDLGDYSAALGNLQSYLQQGHALDAADESWIVGLLYFSDRSLPMRGTVLERLHALDWSPKDSTRSRLDYELALAWIRAGRSEGVAELLAGITLPELLVAVRSDKRFDPYVDRKAPEFDVGRAARARVARLRAGLPTPLAIDSDTADLLRAMITAGQFEDVLALTGPMLEWPPADADPRALAPLLELRSRALVRAGRQDEAVQVQERAAATQVGGQPNVNQTLDLAGLYCSLGRGEDALRAAQRIQDNMNPFGLYVRAYQSQCAYLLKGDVAGAARELAYLQANRELRPSLYADALLRAERMDEAAAAFIALLEDEDTRADTLAAAQDYRPMPDLSTSDARKSAAWRKLVKRSDVKAAIRRVGRIEHHDIEG